MSYLSYRTEQVSQKERAGQREAVRREPQTQRKAPARPGETGRHRVSREYEALPALY